MKKILMINGSPRTNRGTSKVFSALKVGMEQVGASVTVYQLDRLSFQGCKGCLGCKREQGCVLKDDLTPILEDLKRADAIVLGSPIYMFAVSGQLSLFLNRLYSLIDAQYQPYVHKKRAFLSVYSMGSPSAQYVNAEANRIAQAMDMLGFQEIDRIALTRVYPSMSNYSMSNQEYASLKNRGMQFVEHVK